MEVILAGLLVLSGVSASYASEQEMSAPGLRRALRAYPVVQRSGADRPVLLRAIPVDRSSGATARRAGVYRQQGEVVPEAPESGEEMAEEAPKRMVTEVRRLPRGMFAPPSVATLVRRCDMMALEGLGYQFGSDDPLTGGLDCSGAVQYLLRQEGIRNVPRTAYEQYRWLKGMGALNRVSRWTWSADRVRAKLRPGDLMFWRGTYHTGKLPNISHVMIYLGRDANTGKHYMFGSSSRRSKGLHGHAVDVYEFVYPRPHGKDNFTGFGSVPGLGR